MDSLPLHIVDIVVAGVLLISALFAFARGFVRELFSVVGWVGAIFAAIYGMPYVQPYAREAIETEIIADVGAWIAIFLVVLLLISLITGSVSDRVKESSLNVLDRSLGFLFGLARGAILVVLAFILIEWLMVPPAATGGKTAEAKTETPEKKPDPLAWMREARSTPLIESGALMMMSLVPQNDGPDAMAEAARSRRQARQFLESQKLFRDLLTPAPKSDTSKTPEGYEHKERRQMNRLIERNQ